MTKESSDGSTEEALPKRFGACAADSISHAGLRLRSPGCSRNTLSVSLLCSSGWDAMLRRYAYGGGGAGALRTVRERQVA